MSGLNLEPVVFDLFGNNGLSELTDDRELIPKIAIERLEIAGQLNDGQPLESVVILPLYILIMSGIRRTNAPGTCFRDRAGDRS